MAGPERLTERQKACLRLVRQGLGSKEIAIELGAGLTEDAVTARIKAAMRILGVTSRVKAARLLAEHEGIPNLVLPLRELPTGSPTGFFDVTPDWGGDIATGEGGRQLEDSAGFEIGPEFTPPAQPQLSSLLRGRRRNDLTVYERVVRIIMLMILLALTFGLIINGALGVTAMFRSIGRHTATTIPI